MSKIKRNVLKRPDVFRLVRWLDAHWKEIEEKRLDPRQVAKMAGKELEIHIEWTNVRSVAYDMGKDWSHSKRSSKGFHGKGGRDRAVFLAGQILALNEALTHIFDELGVPPHLYPDLDVEGLQEVRTRQGVRKNPKSKGENEDGQVE